MAMNLKNSDREYPSYWKVFLTAILLGVYGFSARAQVECGEMPHQVPVSTQEQLKGDVEGKVKILTKILPGAQIRGAVQMSKNELYQEHQSVDKYQIDMYFMWVSCQAVMHDTHLVTEEKVKLWTDVRNAFGPQHDDLGSSGGVTSELPHDNTFFGFTPVPLGLSQGHDNTFVGATDKNGNTIINTDTVIGSHACGGPGSVVIGSHAMSSVCNHD